MFCPSINTTAGDNQLWSARCVRAAGHEGRCWDGHGHRWWMLSVLLAQQGLVYAGGGRVRRLG